MKRKVVKENGAKLSKMVEQVKTFGGHVEREKRRLNSNSNRKKTGLIVEQFERLARGLTDGLIEMASPTLQVSTVKIKTNPFLPQNKTDCLYQANGIEVTNAMDSDLMNHPPGLAQSAQSEKFVTNQDES